MIDIENERVIPLREVANHVPSRCPGKRVSPATVWRWVMKTLNPLETIKIGGGRFTSVEAIQRFVKAGLHETAQQSPGPSVKAVKAGQELRKLIWIDGDGKEGE